jgi:hypothetical protein
VIRRVQTSRRKVEIICTRTLRAKLALQESRALELTSSDVLDRDSNNSSFPTSPEPTAVMTKKRKRYPDLNQKLEVRNN